MEKILRRNPHDKEPIFIGTCEICGCVFITDEGYDDVHVGRIVPCPICGAKVQVK